MGHILEGVPVKRWDPNIILSDAVTPNPQIEILQYRTPAKFLAPEIRYGDPVSALVAGRNFAVWSESDGLDQASLYLSDYSFAEMFGSGRVLRQLSDQPILVAANAAHGNYWHWLFQCLAPALIARAEGLAMRFLSPVLDKLRRDGLAMAGIDAADVIELHDHELAALPQAVTTNLTAGEHAFMPHPRLVQLLEDMAEQAPPSSLSGQKIYVARDSVKRGLSNEGALAEGLERLGFRTVVTSQLTLAEQMAVFRDAVVIVSAHGAALANLAFCRSAQPPAIVELLQENYINSTFLKLGQVKRLNYTAIVNRMIDPGSDGRHFSTWEAD
ncbi:MAG: glycosyltransferase family 61 protein, partial [Hyphomicrobiales bacterium]